MVTLANWDRDMEDAHRRMTSAVLRLQRRARRAGVTLSWDEGKDTHFECGVRSIEETLCYPRGAIRAEQELLTLTPHGRDAFIWITAQQIEMWRARGPLPCPGR